MNAAQLNELTVEADEWFFVFMERFEEDWQARPATRRPQRQAEALALLEDTNGLRTNPPQRIPERP